MWYNKSIMKKVILKCKLEDRDRFEKKLAEIDLDFSAIYWQHDRVYVPRGYKRGKNLPRLVMRTEMRAVDEIPKYTLIFRRHVEDADIDIIEETKILDYENTVNIILQLGFKPAGEVSRRRQDLKMSENTFIYIDRIDGQDEYYVKIESILTDEDSVEQTKNFLVRTLRQLGETDIAESAYFEL